jgi:hypothetical protein
MKSDRQPTNYSNTQLINLHRLKSILKFDITYNHKIIEAIINIAK